MTTERIASFIAPAPGELTVVEAGDTVLAVGNVDGTLHAVEDECTHAQCSLSEGDLEGTTLICPCHFGRFDITTGAVLGGPPASPVRSWKVVLEGTDLTVTS